MENNNERVMPQENNSPAWKLATNRSMWKMLLLGIITCGIYPTIIYFYMYEDINILASRHDGKRTMHPSLFQYKCWSSRSYFCYPAPYLNAGSFDN